MCMPSPSARFMGRVMRLVSRQTSLSGGRAVGSRRGWLVVELGFVFRLSDSRTMVLNLVCQLKSPRELLSVQMPGQGPSPMKPELLGVGPR